VAMAVVTVADLAWPHGRTLRTAPSATDACGAWGWAICGPRRRQCSRRGRRRGDTREAPAERWRRQPRPLQQWRSLHSRRRPSARRRRRGARWLQLKETRRRLLGTASHPSHHGAASRRRSGRCVRGCGRPCSQIQLTHEGTRQCHRPGTHTTQQQRPAPAPAASAAGVGAAAGAPSATRC
jgi:hypothetical protein